jgi:hypothetical protein
MPENQDFEYDVFLSHNETDKPRVRKLAERLQAVGVRVWFDEWVIKSGDNILLAVEHGLDAARVLVLCMSPNAFGSGWVDLERSAVMFRDPSNAGRRFIPLLLTDCNRPGTLQCCKYIDFRADEDTAFEQLLRDIRKTSYTEPASQSLVMPHVLSSLNKNEKFNNKKFVRPLHVTEDRFLQVLLSHFSLHRHREKGGEKFELSVDFDDNTPTIWNNEAKRYLLDRLPADLRTQYQTKLDDFLLHGRGKDVYDFSAPSFVFRFASGGTLPVISFSDGLTRGEYYCLFFRDAHPVGWNIANGGCDTRAELLNPQDTLERELQEELVIADFNNDRRYVFLADSRVSIDHPAHAVARSLWARKCPDKDLSVLNTAEVEMQWFAGPDSVRIQIGRDKPVSRKGFFLNINGEDFGIEFDKVARIRLPGSAILFDGEIDEGELVNRPIGLFSVERFNSLLQSGKKSFTPDIVFYGAERYDPCQLDYIVKHAFMRHLERIRTPQSVRLMKNKIEAGEQFGLCPVTRCLVERFNKLGGLSRCEQQKDQPKMIQGASRWTEPQAQEGGKVARDVFLRSKTKRQDEVFAVELLKHPVTIKRDASRHVTVTVNRKDVESVLISNAAKTQTVESLVKQENEESLKQRDREIQDFLADDSAGSEIVDKPPQLRWASGGVLSVVSFADKPEELWVPLFFRDIRPYGWNISLGSTQRAFIVDKVDIDDKVDNSFPIEIEWREPANYIEREFLEESLVVVGEPRIGTPLPVKRFSWRVGQPPAQNLARAFDKKHLRLRTEADRLKFIELDEDRWLNVRPIETNCSLDIIARDGKDFRTNDILVCFSLLDLGIEVVKVVNYVLQPGDYLLDGEILDKETKDKSRYQELVRMPVALFSLDYLRRTFAEKAVWQKYTAGPQPSIEVLKKPEEHEIKLFEHDVRRRMEIINSSPEDERGKKEKERFVLWYDKFRSNFLDAEEKPCCKNPSRLFVPGTAKILNLYFTTVEKQRLNAKRGERE